MRLAGFPLVASSLFFVHFWLLCLAPSPASARPTLKPFSDEVLRSYAPMLAHAEMAIVETDAAGHAAQMTLLGYTPAPPQVVYDIVAHPELYPTFVHNLVKSDVEHRPDGSLVNHWRVQYPIGGFEGSDEYRFEAAPAGTVGAIDSASVGPGKEGVYRWEFLAAPNGGTVVVDYGWYDSLRDNALLASMMKRNPAYEAGFNLAGALTVMRSVLAHATEITKVKPPAPAGTVPGFGPLLDRGSLTVVRSGGKGELVDVSVVERVPAPMETLLGLLRAPDKWPAFLRFVKRVDVKRRDEQGIDYDMAVSGILLEVVTTYRTNFIANGTDTLGVGGELKGSRHRWDLSPAGPDATVAVWRGNLHLGAASALLRGMFRIEPSFEHAGNVSVGLISMRAMSQRAAEVTREAAAARHAPSVTPPSSLPESQSAQ